MDPKLPRGPLDARRVGLIPFTSDRKWMAGFYQQDGAVVTFAKGAPRAIFDVSASALMKHGLAPLDDSTRRSLEGINDHLASEGLRVLAVASGPVTDLREASVQGLTFLGFIGLADPPAAGVRETVATLRTAGLRTIMLTGDQRLTAAAVGRTVGLLSAQEHSLDGRDIEHLDPTALDAAIARTSVFSRVTPEHKLVIVRAR